MEACTPLPGGAHRAVARELRPRGLYTHAIGVCAADLLLLEQDTVLNRAIHTHPQRSVQLLRGQHFAAGGAWSASQVRERVFQSWSSSSEEEAQGESHPKGLLLLPKCPSALQILNV